jgi:uncharacterized protein YbdZ (MbtH family)
MKTYKIEAMKINAETKKEAVLKYLDQHWITFMTKPEKKFSTLYKSSKEI